MHTGRGIVQRHQRLMGRIDVTDRSSVIPKNVSKSRHLLHMFDQFNAEAVTILLTNASFRGMKQRVLSAAEQLEFSNQSIEI